VRLVGGSGPTGPAGAQDIERAPDSKPTDPRREYFDTLDRLEGLAGIAVRSAGANANSDAARELADRLTRRQLDHRAARIAWRRKFGVGAALDVSTLEGDANPTLEDVRQRLDDLMNAYAEGLSTLKDRVAVDTFARQMVVISQQRTVIDLWIAAEAA
jgi:hypothetical protein